MQSTGGAQKLVWHWYYVHGHAVSNVYKAKLLNAWGTLRGDPSATALVLTTDVGGTLDTSQAEANLRRFMADARRAVEECIDGVAAKCAPLTPH
jgi:EpsI family protein